MKTQVVIVGGGEAFSTREEYLAWLENPDYDPYEYLDNPDETFTSWSRALLEVLGDDYEVVKVDMPAKLNAKYDEWEIWFKHFLRHARDGCILIGHSLGANFWTKYLSEHDYPTSIKQLHLVAGCFGYAGGFEFENDFKKLNEQVGEIHIYHSSDDTVVPIDDAHQYKDALPDANLHMFDDRGHFIIEEFPELVENIKSI